LALFKVTACNTNHSTLTTATGHNNGKDAMKTASIFSYFPYIKMFMSYASFLIPSLPT
jgi:hypothetical protein